MPGSFSVEYETKKLIFLSFNLYIKKLMKKIWHIKF